MSSQTSQHTNKSKDPYASYASAVAPRILEQANRIFEDFPVSRYLLYFAVFMIEVAVVFYIGIVLAR